MKIDFKPFITGLVIGAGLVLLTNHLKGSHSFYGRFGGFGGGGGGGFHHGFGNHQFNQNFINPGFGNHPPGGWGHGAGYGPGMGMGMFNPAGGIPQQNFATPNIPSTPNFPTSNPLPGPITSMSRGGGYGGGFSATTPFGSISRGGGPGGGFSETIGNMTISKGGGPGGGFSVNYN